MAEENERVTYQCSRCRKKFFEDGFKINRLGRRLKTCLECSASKAAYRAAHSESLAALQRAYYASNKVTILQACKTYRQTNSEDRKTKASTPEECECGAIVTHAKVSKHLMSLKHTYNIAIKNGEPVDPEVEAEVNPGKKVSEDARRGGFELIGPYTNVHTPTEFECNRCHHRYTTRWEYLKYSWYCAGCKKSKYMPDAEIDEILAELQL
jgi:hypothetical protein